MFTFVKTRYIYICERDFRIYSERRGAQQCALCCDYGCGAGIHLTHFVGTQQAELWLHREIGRDFSTVRCPLVKYRQGRAIQLHSRTWTRGVRLQLHEQNSLGATRHTGWRGEHCTPPIRLNARLTNGNPTFYVRHPGIRPLDCLLSRPHIRGVRQTLKFSEPIEKK